MKNSLNLDGRDTATIIMIIVTIIATLISAVDTIQYFYKPNLTYDMNNKQYINDNLDSLAYICVRNEGYEKADNITIYIYTNGEIKKSFISKGIIGKGVFDVYELQINKIDNQYYILNIPHIVPGMEYNVFLSVNCRGHDPIDEIMVESENGGVAREYSKNNLYKYIGYSVPFLAVIMLLIIFIRKRGKNNL